MSDHYVNGITYADIQQAREEYEAARIAEVERIERERERRANDLLNRGLARVRRNSEGFGE
jgi:hypothetical protein